MKTRWLVVMTLVCGCAAGGDETLGDNEDFSGLDDSLAADHATGNTQLVGTTQLGFGRTVLYRKTPRYRAVKFSATAGTMLEVYVRSKHGDPMTWLLDANLDIVAYSDDANEETNSNISIESLAESGDYYIVFRDKHLASHYFDVAPVQLNLPANAPTVASIESVYEAHVAASTLASTKIAASTLPFLAKGLHDRWAGEVAGTPGLQVGAYKLTVGNQTVWLVRRYLPGEGVAAGAYTATGPMVGIAGGATEQIDSWEN
jgi:hypothetical protein